MIRIPKESVSFRRVGVVGTPVLDIKVYIPLYDSFPFTEAPL
ncbi:MAG: hypothetical protein PHX14_08155 [Syntrophomonadaceae bacterium]|nr:hypothetical protein [Syntrophomonadaceae bacterium]